MLRTAVAHHVLPESTFKDKTPQGIERAWFEEQHLWESTTVKEEITYPTGWTWTPLTLFYRLGNYDTKDGVLTRENAIMTE